VTTRRKVHGSLGCLGGLRCCGTTPTPRCSKYSRNANRALVGELHRYATFRLALKQRTDADHAYSAEIERCLQAARDRCADAERAQDDDWHRSIVLKN
jgi:hypothetical protein